jgi:hypothetical protein
MDVTRRLAIEARRCWRPARIPPLLPLRSAIGLLVVLALAAGAEAPAPPAVTNGSGATAAGPDKTAPHVTATPVRRKRSVFVCDDAGTPMYTDRPCGPDFAKRSIRFELPGTGQAASTVPNAPQASTRPRVRQPDRNAGADVAAERCTALRRQLDELDDRMRTGYSSREAAKLWERRRDLKDHLRGASC